MRALHRSLMVAGIVAPMALSLSPLAFAGESHDDGHHDHGDKKGHSKHHDAPKCGISGVEGGASGGDHMNPPPPAGPLALLGVLTSTTESVLGQDISQTATQSQDNSTDQSNSLVAPVVQVNPVILGEGDSAVGIDNEQGNANSTAQGQDLCQAAAGGDQAA
jgi:hypothetical protein